MNKSKWLGSMAMSAVLLAGHAYAQDDDTMEVGDDVEDIINMISLPDMASDIARDSAAKGLETANAARQDGRAFGQSMAEGRGEAGRDIGEAGRDIGAAAREAAAEIASDARESASETAAQARENAADAAAEARDNAADRRPETPGRP